MAVSLPGRSRFSSRTLAQESALRALRVEVMSVDPGSSLLRSSWFLEDASSDDDGLGVSFRVVSGALRENVSLRASIRSADGRPVARLSGRIHPVGTTFDVVTKEDLDWLLR